MNAEPRYPSDEADRFQVRMPPGMRERIADAAKANGRSMNAEIVARLEQSLSGQDAYDAGQRRLDEVLAHMERFMERLDPEGYAEFIKQNDKARATR